MNTTVKTAAVPNAAVAVPVGTTPVIAAMITTVIVPVLTAAVIASWHDRRRRHARTGGPGAAISRSTHGRVHSTAFEDRRPDCEDYHERRREFPGCVEQNSGMVCAPTGRIIGWAAGRRCGELTADVLVPNLKCDRLAC